MSFYFGTVWHFSGWITEFTMINKWLHQASTLCFTVAQSAGSPWKRSSYISYASWQCLNHVLFQSLMFAERDSSYVLKSALNFRSAEPYPEVANSSFVVRLPSELYNWQWFIFEKKFISQIKKIKHSRDNECNINLKYIQNNSNK